MDSLTRTDRAKLMRRENDAPDLYHPLAHLLIPFHHLSLRYGGQVRLSKSNDEEAEEKRRISADWLAVS
jgi:hypothetical protein